MTHPISPPPELVQQWVGEVWYEGHQQRRVGVSDLNLADRAAQWGADQELEACINWIAVYQGLDHPELLIELLRDARRPKPQSLAEEALALLQPREPSLFNGEMQDTLRRALEKLRELEGGND